MQYRKIVLQREPSGWHVMADEVRIALDLAPHAASSEAVALVRARYCYGRLGVRAADLGPGAALVAGHDGVIWMRR